MTHVYLTVDLGFGDSGKGTIVDYLVREHDAHTVVRYNGGAQAGHRVVTPDGREHVFAQFGSGTLAGAATHLGPWMLIDPFAMVPEADHLEALGVADVWERTTLDRRALVITPYQRAVNRLKEMARGAGRHGSCGMGVGETMLDALDLGDAALRAGDLADPATVRAKLRELRERNRAKIALLLPKLTTPQAARELDMLMDDDDAWIVEHYADIAARLRVVGPEHLASLLQDGTVVFEAAQGVLLDEWQGFHPYTTWSTTTLERADALLAEAGYAGPVTRIGITRAYATRHGAGPFVTEDTALGRALPDAANFMGDWQGGFRVGWLDLVMLRYARDVIGTIDQLAVTCLDRVAPLPEIKVCRRYEREDTTLERIALAPRGDLDAQEAITNQLLRCRPVLETVADVDTLVAMIGAELDVPVGIVSAGPSATDKRAWANDLAAVG